MTDPIGLAPFTITVFTRSSTILSLPESRAMEALQLPQISLHPRGRREQATGEFADRLEPNMPFEEYWRPVDGSKNSPHHRRGVKTFYPERSGSERDQLAISCVLRDRNFVKGWRRLLGLAA